ncbi:MAG: hypothetical protein VW867_08555, partial [Gammaproteobacteria bacterium]
TQHRADSADCKQQGFRCQPHGDLLVGDNRTKVAKNGKRDEKFPPQLFDSKICIVSVLGGTVKGAICCWK